MVFAKNGIPWNKGTVGVSSGGKGPRISNSAWTPERKENHVPWNKGLLNPYTAEMCKRMSETRKRLFREGLLEVSVHPNRSKCVYKGRCFRSSWESKFAEYLDLISVEWLYEPKRFALSNTTYLPDFYLPEIDTYVEIKGQGGFSKAEMLEEELGLKVAKLKRDELNALGVFYSPTGKGRTPV